MGAWIRRHRVVTALGAIAALGSAGVVAFALDRRPRHRRHDRRHQGRV